MSGDRDLEEEYMASVADRFTAYELVEELDLTVEQIIAAFYEEILERRPLG